MSPFALFCPLHGHSRRAVAARLLKADGRPVSLGCVDEYIRRLYAKLNAMCVQDVLLRLLQLRLRVVAAAMPRPDPQTSLDPHGLRLR